MSGSSFRYNPTKIIKKDFHAPHAGHDANRLRRIALMRDKVADRAFRRDEGRYYRNMVGLGWDKDESD